MTVPWLTFIRGRSAWMRSMVIDQDAAVRLNGNHGSELKSGLPICIPSKVHIERQGSSYACDPWISSTTRAQNYAVLSTTFAFGALVATDLIPFSIARVDEYISLLPIVSPLPAVRTKYGLPSLAVLRM